MTMDTKPVDVGCMCWNHVWVCCTSLVFRGLSHTQSHSKLQPVMRSRHSHTSNSLYKPLTAFFTLLLGLYDSQVLSIAHEIYSLYHPVDFSYWKSDEKIWRQRERGCSGLPCCKSPWSYSSCTLSWPLYSIIAIYTGYRNTFLSRT